MTDAANKAGDAAAAAADEAVDTIIELVETVNWGAVLVAFVVGGAVTAGMLWLFFSQTVDDVADEIEAIDTQSDALLDG